MPEPVDKALYERIKKKVNAKNPHSAAKIRLHQVEYFKKKKGK